MAMTFQVSSCWIPVLAFSLTPSFFQYQLQRHHSKESLPNSSPMEWESAPPTKNPSLKAELPLSSEAAGKLASISKSAINSAKHPNNPISSPSKIKASAIIYSSDESDERPRSVLKDKNDIISDDDVWEPSKKVIEKVDKKIKDKSSKTKSKKVSISRYWNKLRFCDSIGIILSMIAPFPP